MFGVSGLRSQQLQAQYEGTGKRHRPWIRYGIWALLWVAGHVAGGVLLGAALGWLGSGLPPATQPAGLVVLSGGCLGMALHQLQVLRLPLPQLHRQVSRLWLVRLPWDLVALGYGLQLGCGVATRIKVATTYAVLGCAFLSGSALAGGFILGAFGAARSVLPVVLGPWVASPKRALSFALKFDDYAGRVGKLNGAVLLAAAGFLAGLAWHTLAA